MSVPHDSWARYYDLVMDRTFGEAYRSFTDRTLEVVGSVIVPPGRIVDFGAGTGRLAIPLAREGYEVTAVDPSSEMLATLRDSAGDIGIEAIVGRMEDYRTEHVHDMALCVFTVLVYMLDHAALRAAARSAARALRPGGLLLVDVPSESVFESFDVETADVIRCVDIESNGDSRFRYRERTAVRLDDDPVSYEDDFEIRHWKPEEIRSVLVEAGFEVRQDMSDQFTTWGAGYLLLER